MGQSREGQARLQPTSYVEIFQSLDVILFVPNVFFLYVGHFKECNGHLVENQAVFFLKEAFRKGINECYYIFDDVMHTQNNGNVWSYEKKDELCGMLLVHDILFFLSSFEILRKECVLH